jgi:hypothetical protein
MFEKWRNAGLVQIFLPGKAIGRGNPDGFQVQAAQSWRKKMPQDGVFPFFKHGLDTDQIIKHYKKAAMVPKNKTLSFRK